MPDSPGSAVCYVGDQALACKNAKITMLWKGSHVTRQSESIGRRLPIFGVAVPGVEEEAALVGAGVTAQAQGGVGLGPGWADLPNGAFGTEDAADLITYEVQKKAVPDDVVEFTLAISYTSSGWAKAIIMPDGEGNNFIIQAQGRGSSASNGLYVGQTKKGQVLTFRKPKGFGIWYDVIQIGYLEGLDPGDRVMFTWQHD
ncbi:hypothetical protein AB0I69_22390 [Streptomyces sp. NPDC050508]|uniref:hypothetical protein n=1 Tax=Streptomyces sp. NPDC050508 TaxID=3155405 RepID=UPI0034396607